MSKAIAITSEYRNLSLSQLQESPTNPRRRFDERALEELAASFTTQGVLQPLLVRAVSDDRYEVIAGARRFRAAKLASLKEVPARIVELSDAAVRESQLTENLLREDVHPMKKHWLYPASCILRERTTMFRASRPVWANRRPTSQLAFG